MWLPICLLCLLCAANAAIMNITAAAAPQAAVAAAAATTASSDDSSPNSIKMDALNRALQQIDHAVQNLEEKAHNWAIFRHHIDAWNEQLKTLEHKLDLVKRAQDEQQAVGSKLISLEFTLNHILSKVLYLSDNCNVPHMRDAMPNDATTNSRSHSRSSSIQTNDEQQDTNALLSEQIELLGDLREALSADKRQHNEIGTRLSNILRHVQNIERDRGQRTSTATATTPFGGNSNKMAKIMAPIGNGCNDTKRITNANMERALRALEQQLSALATRAPTAKEHRQLQALTKKNAQQLEHILRVVTSADERLLQWRDDGVRGWRHCAALDGELTTFTESSDLLLKRIELVVREVNEKLNCARKDAEDADVASNGGETEARTVVDADGEVDAEVEQEPEPEPPIDSDIGAEEDEDAINKIDTEENVPESNDVDRDESSAETASETETVASSANVDKTYDLVEFLQPDKQACHQLDMTVRVDMVYKFGTPEPNEIGRDFNERYCAFATNGPAWTVIQNRGAQVQQENFNRSWNEYRNGFGELNKEFWYGNEFIYQLVDHDDYELRIELHDFENEHVWAEYVIFRLDSERYNYNLLIGGHSGTAPDAMHYHNEIDFSTYDRRNDRSVDACCACAMSYASGWWFDNCSEANLNGIYRASPTGHNYIGIIWEPWHGDYSLKQARMMLRPKRWSTRADEHDTYNEFNEDP